MAAGFQLSENAVTAFSLTIISDDDTEVPSRKREKPMKTTDEFKRPRKA